MITVEESKVNMMGTKIEVVLAKADAGSWSKLGDDRWKEQQQQDTKDEKKKKEEEEVKQQVDALDLDDLEVSNVQMRLSDEAMGKRSTT